jgi:hypothetical protein
VTETFEKFQNPSCKPPGSNPLSTEYGGAFIDLNMDCRPDLLVESFTSLGRSQELYLYTDKGFCFVKQIIVPSDFSFVSFVDISQRGANDAVFVTNNMEVRVFRNKHKLGDEDRTESFDANILSKNFDLCIEKDHTKGEAHWPFQDYADSKINEVRFNPDTQPVNCYRTTTSSNSTSLTPTK